jgi:hypothetical protein
MQVTRAAVVLAPSADAFSGTKTTKVIDRGFYGRRLFFVIAHKGSPESGTGRYTITAELCQPDGTSPLAVEFEYWLASGPGDEFGPKQLALPAGFTVPAASEQTIVVHVLPAVVPMSDLIGLRLKTVETVDDPVVGSIVAYCADPVQGGDDVVSMLLS